VAGYILYSLDWDKFAALVERPTAEQLRVLADLVADAIENPIWDFDDDDDPVLAWPDDPAGLPAVVARRLARTDWYGDLSDGGKTAWEGAIFQAGQNGDEHGLDLAFRVESDGVYWDVIDFARRELRVPPNKVTAVALSAFGTRPFRHPTAGRSGDDGWAPMHSMHPPDEVRRMADELRSLAAAAQRQGEEVRGDFAELLAAVERVAADGRLLFVQVDT